RPGGVSVITIHDGGQRWLLVVALGPQDALRQAAVKLVSGRSAFQLRQTDRHTSGRVAMPKLGRGRKP
ncbi:MAG TPA: hypothetical protein VE592_13550, partial [Geminicoccaceae bacterium]|nr:hypothetical protein [Geminicoccaceae bacterium]